MGVGVGDRFAIRMPRGNCSDAELSRCCGDGAVSQLCPYLIWCVSEGEGGAEKAQERHEGGRDQVVTALLQGCAGKYQEYAVWIRSRHHPCCM